MPGWIKAREVSWQGSSKTSPRIYQHAGVDFGSEVALGGKPVLKKQKLKNEINCRCKKNNKIDRPKKSHVSR